ncbi:MAG: DinB family protein [Bacteroidetes bacterium]|nr:DinB family protein [Bacteroidota bacterium]
MPKPNPATHPGYFQRYISQVPEDDLTAAFQNQLPVMTAFFKNISEEKSAYAYAEGKWTIKELLQHMIDTERIFAYRSLCFARHEQQSLPGFDENTYAANSNANKRKWSELIDEFLSVRQTTEILFSSFTEAALNHSGIANNNPCTALSMGFTAIGHVYHHIAVMKERYL